MLNKFYVWLGKHWFAFIAVSLTVSSGLTIYNLVDVVRAPPSVKDFKGGVQNHLVWSVKGECFFVKPYADNVINLIRVEDCDKK